MPSARRPLPDPRTWRALLGTGPEGRPQVEMCDPHSLLRSPWQARRSLDTAALADLVASVRVMGVLEPVLARVRADGRKEVIAGTRRWMAAKIADIPELPVICLVVTDAQAALIGAMENLVRADLSIADEAELYIQMIARGVARSRRALADALGVPVARIDRALLLADAPAVLAAVDDGRLTQRRGLLLAQHRDICSDLAAGRITLADALDQLEARVGAAAAQWPPEIPARVPASAAEPDPPALAIVPPDPDHPGWGARAGSGRLRLLPEVVLWSGRFDAGKMLPQDWPTILAEAQAARAGLDAVIADLHTRVRLWETARARRMAQEGAHE